MPPTGRISASPERDAGNRRAPSTHRRAAGGVRTRPETRRCPRRFVPETRRTWTSDTPASRPRRGLARRRQAAWGSQAADHRYATVPGPTPHVLDHLWLDLPLGQIQGEHGLLPGRLNASDTARCARRSHRPMRGPRRGMARMRRAGKPSVSGSDGQGLPRLPRAASRWIGATL